MAVNVDLRGQGPLTWPKRTPSSTRWAEKLPDLCCQILNNANDTIALGHEGSHVDLATSPSSASRANRLPRLVWRGDGN